MPCHHTRRRATLLLALALALAGCAAPPRERGQAIAFERQGRGDPPIVLQSGLGDDRTPWAAVARALQPGHTVFSYDRPGYGGSAATAAPRDPCSLATELRALLTASGLRPPYVLVGHSLGGLYQYVYARLYPDDVAALVLLDPTHPQHWASMQAEAPAAAMAVKALRATAFTPTARREFDQQADCLTQLDARPQRPLPTRVLVSTRFGPVEGAEFQRMLGRLRTDWLRLTGAAALVAVPHAGHYLQRDAPEAVVRELRAVQRLSHPHQVGPAVGVARGHAGDGGVAGGDVDH